jgi:hypothetical protein
VGGWDTAHFKAFSNDSLQTVSMEDPSVTFLNLEHLSKRQVHILLCHHALLVWETYAQQHSPFDYVDSVVGMEHRFDVMLPRDALTSVLTNNELTDIAYRFQEPIVALQDDDITFPAHIEFAYYAIYNLYKKYIEGAAIDDWLIVNQALSSEVEPLHWQPLLIQALENAHTHT